MVKSHTIIFKLFTILAGWGGADAQPIPTTLDPCGRAVVDSATSGDRLILQDSGQIVLSAVKAPELWPDDSPYASWPYANEARAILEKLTAGKVVHFYCEGETTTMSGDRIAHVQLPNGNWLQHDLLMAGAVFVFPRAGHNTGLPSLYEAELSARSTKNGLWNGMDILASAQDYIPSGWFKIVAGSVQSAKKVGKRVFLNFGGNWREDFTVEIPSPTLRQFDKTGLNPLAMENRQIEVRGWVTWKGGPHILLETPGQIRLQERTIPDSGISQTGSNRIANTAHK